MNWPVRMVRLSSDPAANGLWCGLDGVKLAGQPLLDKTAAGFVRLMKLMRALNELIRKHLDVWKDQAWRPGLWTIANS